MGEVYAFVIIDSYDYFKKDIPFVEAMIHPERKAGFFYN